MPNGLTGDFDVVLQVSGTTVARLVAAMHQNSFADAQCPSLPHVAWFRIEGSPARGGEHGSVAAQIGVPRVVLLDGSTDRVRVEIGFRARFRADPGSPRFADVFRGTVHALYRIQDIDSSCAGWRDSADDYLWLRVVRSSVSFEGVAYTESPDFLLTVTDDQADLTRRIGQHLAALLAGPFAPQPHRIGKRFKRMRSLSAGSGMDASGVLFPLGVGSDVPAGDLASVSRLFLGGHDFAVAVSADYLLGRVRDQLATVVPIQRDYHISGDAGWGGGLEIDYHVRLDTADAQWLGSAPFGLSMGVIRLAVSGHGWSTRLYRSGVYNIGSIDIDELNLNFTVEQYVTVHFDAAGEVLLLVLAGKPAVLVNYGGPFAGEVKSAATKELSKQATSALVPMLGNAQAQLNAFAAPEKKAALTEMVQSVDPAAAAHFDAAEFRTDGVVLRGTIRLGPHRPPAVAFAKSTGRDGFDAIESWIPGGRVDTLEWTWQWFTNPVQAPPGPPGSATQHESFLLRRPQRSRTKFGLAVGAESPLPGIDGMGQVCLRISGVRVDAVTGAWVPVRSVVECTRFGFQFRMPVEMGPYLRVCDPLRATDGRPAPEVALMRVATADATSNTLVVHMGERWDDETADTIIAGLQQCRREEVGVLVLVLLRDGVLARADRESAAQMRRFVGECTAPVLVADDPKSRWADGLALDEHSNEADWLLLDPSGVPRWAHRGVVSTDRLAGVLDERLQPSPFTGPVAMRPGPQIGDRFPIALFAPNCPPIPLARSDTAGSRVVFIDRLDDLTTIRSAPADSGPPVAAVVVDGISEEEVRAGSDAPGVPVLADPDGSLTRGAGVLLTPSVLTVDGLGNVCDVAVLAHTVGRAGR